MKLDFDASDGEFLDSGPARSMVFPLIVIGAMVEKLPGEQKGHGRLCWLRFYLMPCLRDRALDKNLTWHKPVNRLEEMLHFAYFGCPCNRFSTSRWVRSTSGITMHHRERAGTRLEHLESWIVCELGQYVRRKALRIISDWSRCLGSYSALS
jgi:hypothetical protein